MKKLLLLFATIQLSVVANAYDFTDNGIYFNLKSDGSLEVTGLASWTTRADILSDVTINGRTYRVTSIGAHAFEGRSDITYLSIPWSVTSIGEYAFIDCGSNLTVNIADPESWCQMQLGNEHSSPLSSAGKVLVHDIETTNIVIPEGVTSIGNFTFYQCRCINSLTIPGSVNSIGSSAFEDCSGLTSIYLSEGIESIGGSSFEGCTGISSLILPSSLTSIAINAFKNCTKLKTIISNKQDPFAIDNTVFVLNSNEGGIYDSGTLIVPVGSKSAYQLTAQWNRFANIIEASEAEFLIRVEIDGLWYYLRSKDKTATITSNRSGERYSGDIIIPDRVSYMGVECQITSIDPYAFSGCVGLTSLVIGDKIKSIGEEAFYGCSSLTSVIMGRGVRSIGDEAFYGCKNMNAIQIKDLGAWCNIHFSYFRDTNPLEHAHHLFLNGKEIKDLIIPDDVTAINNFAFHGCSSITSVTIPNSVTTIGSTPFQGCNGLATIVSEIEDPYDIGENVFNSNIYSTATMIVPKGKKSTYQATAGWKKFATIIEVGGVGYKFESDGIYYIVGENNTLSVISGEVKYSGDIVIPSEVTYFGKTYSVISIGGFQGCSGLTSVTIPNSVTNIRNNAFYNCGNLPSITIPNSVTRIGESSFQNCSNLTSVAIGSGVTFIDEFAFRGCDKLVSVYITDLAAWCRIHFEYAGPSDTNPLEYAPRLYLNGIEIKDLIIPNSVTSISQFAFFGWRGLTSVTIPNSVTSIGINAFSGCSGLTTIVSEIEKPFAMGTNVFYSSDKDIYATATLIVPKGTKATYQTTEGWKQFTNIKEVGEFEVDGICYTIGENNTVSVRKKSTKYSGDVVIPSQVNYNGTIYTVTTIGGFAFGNFCTELTSITIPPTVTTFESSAFFDYLFKLSAVYITDLGAWCKIIFKDEDANPLRWAHHLYLNGEEIKDLTIPKGITSINRWAFNGCNGLTSVTISNSVASIGSFAFRGCSGLTTIVSEIENPFEIDGRVFYSNERDIYATATLIVPKGTKAAYQATEGWNKFANIFEVGDVNGDNKINNDDLNAIVRHIMGKTPANFNAKVADLNNDGKVNVADVTILVKIIKNIQ